MRLRGPWSTMVRLIGLLAWFPTRGTDNPSPNWRVLLQEELWKCSFAATPLQQEGRRPEDPSQNLPRVGRGAAPPCHAPGPHCPPGSSAAERLGTGGYHLLEGGGEEQLLLGLWSQRRPRSPLGGCCLLRLSMVQAPCTGQGTFGLRCDVRFVIHPLAMRPYWGSSGKSSSLVMGLMEVVMVVARPLQAHPSPVNAQPGTRPLEAHW